MKAEKPLGHKAYGSIPHLPGSRLGPGEHHCEQGQARICLEKTRDKHDMVIVQEKLDGSNVCVAKDADGKMHILTRAGYPALSSPYEQHHRFHTWAMESIEQFRYLLQRGERLCGEWLAQAHGTRYDLPHEPFVALDLFTGKTRIPYNDFIERVYALGFVVPRIIHRGWSSFPLDKAIMAVESSGHGAIDPVEGVIYRVERKGEVDFLAKYVRHDKEDGRYLPERNGTGLPIWNGAY